MLCFLFEAKCVKTSESVTYIWVTGGSKESRFYIKFIQCCYSHYLCDPYVSHSPPNPHAAEMVLPDILHCYYIQEHDRTF